MAELGNINNRDLLTELLPLYYTHSILSTYKLLRKGDDKGHGSTEISSLIWF